MSKGNISTSTVDIVEALGEHTEVAGETAFRYAAATWMQSNKMCRIVLAFPAWFWHFHSHESQLQDGFPRAFIRTA